MAYKKSGSASFFSSRLTSVISIALALYMTGVFFVFGLLSRGLSVYMKENLAFSVVLKDDLRESDIRRMQDYLEAQPFVRSTEYVSKAEAAEEMKAELGEDPEVFLGYNPFHASIGVTLKSEYANAENLREIEKKLTADVRVMELAYRKDIMQTVNDNIRRIGLVLALLIALLMVISFVLIDPTPDLLETFSDLHHATGGRHAGIHPTAIHPQRRSERCGGGWAGRHVAGTDGGLSTERTERTGPYPARGWGRDGVPRTTIAGHGAVGRCGVFFREPLSVYGAGAAVFSVARSRVRGE